MRRRRKKVFKIASNADLKMLKMGNSQFKKKKDLASCTSTFKTYRSLSLSRKITNECGTAKGSEVAKLAGQKWVSCHRMMLKLSEFLPVFLKKRESNVVKNY